MKTFNDYYSNLNESGLSRLYKHYIEHDSGTITAYRNEYTEKENKERNHRLKASLLGYGFSVTEIDGVFIEGYKSDNPIEVKERSFFVVDIKDKGNLKQVLKKLGETYQQDSITVTVKDNDKRKYILIGTSKTNNYPEYGKEIVLGEPMFGNDGEFHSKVKGRPFVFKESEYMSIHDFDDRLEKYNNGSKFYIKKIFKEDCSESE